MSKFLQYPLVLLVLFLTACSSAGVALPSVQEDLPKKLPESDAMIKALESSDQDTYCGRFPGCFAYEVTKDQNEFVEVRIAYGKASGGLALFRKNKGGYTLVQMYQEPPQCEHMKKYNVPKSFYERCYDEDGKLIEK